MSKVLASIQKINEIRPIEGADFVVMARIQDYETVVKKGEFNVGDEVIYIECDALVPERPEFEFLRDTKFKIKIRRFKGQISMGLVLPKTMLPRAKLGDDVTDLLDIKNYVKMAEESEELKNADTIVIQHRSKTVKYLMQFAAFRKVYLSLNSVDKGSFPQWISKTDEENIQNISKAIVDGYDATWNITEKLEGQSGTFFTKRKFTWGIPKLTFGVCSRNIWLKTKNNSTFWRVAERYDLEKKLKKLKKEITIQAEVCGPTIQGNIYKLNEIDMFVFNVIENGNRYNYSKMKTFCESLGLKCVPEIFVDFIPSVVYGTMADKKEIVDMVVDMSNGNSLLYPTLREGCVWRRNDKPHISFKAKSPNYELAKSKKG